MIQCQLTSSWETPFVTHWMEKQSNWNVHPPKSIHEGWFSGNFISKLLYCNIFLQLDYFVNEKNFTFYWFDLFIVTKERNIYKLVCSWGKITQNKNYFENKIINTKNHHFKIILVINCQEKKKLNLSVTLFQQNGILKRKSSKLSFTVI